MVVGYLALISYVFILLRYAVLINGDFWRNIIFVLICFLLKMGKHFSERGVMYGILSLNWSFNRE